MQVQTLIHPACPICLSICSIFGFWRSATYPDKILLINTVSPVREVGSAAQCFCPPLFACVAYTALWSEQTCSIPLSHPGGAVGSRPFLRHTGLRQAVHASCIMAVHLQCAQFQRSVGTSPTLRMEHSSEKSTIFPMSYNHLLRRVLPRIRSQRGSTLALGRVDVQARTFNFR